MHGLTLSSFLKPGKNAVRLKLADLKNNDGSAPDFSAVHHWHLLCEGTPPPVFFSDFWLTGRVEIKDTSDPARLARIRAAKRPAITQPVMHGTPEADAILAALESFPPDNAINQTIASWPVHPNSARIIASIGAGKPLRYNPDMAFVFVPPGQSRVPIELGEYKTESDAGPYPVPANAPIEGWPAHYQRDAKLRALTLAEVQADKLNEGGDRHALVVDPVNRMLYEFYQLKRTPGGWSAAQASIFDLKTNALRPKDWTSSDATGLPVFPLVVRHDELARGAIEHAMRITVSRSRRVYVSPATHHAGHASDANLPRMGERLRLRASFDTSGCSANVRVILEALKKYGALVADNGLDFALSVAPDVRRRRLRHSTTRRF